MKRTLPRRKRGKRYRKGTWGYEVYSAFKETRNTKAGKKRWRLLFWLCYLRARWAMGF